MITAVIPQPGSCVILGGARRALFGGSRSSGLLEDRQVRLDWKAGCLDQQARHVRGDRPHHTYAESDSGYVVWLTTQHHRRDIVVAKGVGEP
jgi:hypothetical protein